MKTQNRKADFAANQLIDEKSPYLLQHAYNPVKWHPWEDEVFLEARRKDVPVFLSIGYSTCHWCHVMAEESFEDPEVAEILNRSFLPVKVDREERPDIDAVYMAACQALTGSGGWPLTIIMTPEKEPFFAGTYFPKKGNGRTAGLIEILLFVEKSWRQDRRRLQADSQTVTAFLKENEEKDRASAWDQEELLHAAEKWFFKNFDKRWGGFGPAPKFPSAHNLLFLMGQKGQLCMQMAEKTLVQMYRGGMFDHIGGGFCRYSTDERWLVPHFEKMLYDNAWLLAAYAQAYSLTGNPFYRQVGEQIFEYIEQELTDPEGGFWCGQDADSNGREGLFYLFSPGEVCQVLGETDGPQFCSRFDITAGGNFEGKSIPNLIGADEYVRQERKDVRERLSAYRRERASLGTDDKILTGWNGLMIAALARSAVIMERPRFLKAAQRAEGFLWGHIHMGNGRIMARWRQGEAKYPGILDDYAFFIWGLLECYGACYDAEYLEKAELLGERMLEQFFDWEKGGCYLYGRDSEKLFVRPKEIYDGAMPSGNSAAALVMRRLSFFTGKQKWREAWEKQKQFFLQKAFHPAGHGFFLHVLQEERRGQLIGVGEESIRDEKMSYLNLDILIKTRGCQEKIEKLAPFLKDYPIPEKGNDFYFCQNHVCSEVVHSLDEVQKIVDIFLQ